MPRNGMTERCLVRISRSQTRESRPPLQQSVAAERVFERRVVFVDEVAVDVMLDMEAGGIGPIVEDLAAVEMAADAPAMLVALVDHRLVPHAEIVEVAALERDMVHSHDRRADDGERVVVGPGGAFVEV